MRRQRGLARWEAAAWGLVVAGFALAGFVEPREVGVLVFLLGMLGAVLGMCAALPGFFRQWSTVLQPLTVRLTGLAVVLLWLSVLPRFLGAEGDPLDWLRPVAAVAFLVATCQFAVAFARRG